MTLETDKRLCDECRLTFTAERVLRAKHPFIENDTVDGCPNCYAVGSIRRVCDEPGCWKEATCGWPTKDWATTKIYRHTCGKHWKE